MRIKHIRAAKLHIPTPVAKTEPSRPAWVQNAEVASPMSRYSKYKPLRALWMPRWGQVACVVTAEDGTWGLGVTSYSEPVTAIINDHFAPKLEGESCMATEKLWDMMFRLASPFSSSGLASYAISAVDLALWDLKGKLLKMPVYNV